MPNFLINISLYHSKCYNITKTKGDFLMKQLSKEELEELVTKISTQECEIILSTLKEDINELITENKTYESLLVSMFPLIMEYNLKISRNTIIEVLNNIMNE